MTVGGRRSVDVPISKSLVALRRVRSLRDPCTNSLSKFSALADNVNWETDSNNGISLRFMDGFTQGDPVGNGLMGSKKLGACAQREKHIQDYEHNGLRKTELVLSENSVWLETNDPALRTKNIREFDYSSSNDEEIHKNKTLGEKHCSDQGETKLELAYIIHSGNNLQDMEHSEASQRESRYTYRIKSSPQAAAAASCISSPSSYNQPQLATEDVYVADRNHLGCGTRWCWSRTPSNRESNLSFDVEESPLLSGYESEMDPGRRIWKSINNGVTKYLGTPRSLCQKFRPKSFNELVGQNVVVRSLLETISKGRITSFYLFHGPRGTGKTSASRIFAAALNCLSLEEQKPCGLCRECVLFYSGRSRDVKEVDSVRINRSSMVKSLMKNAVTPPVSSRFKVYIVDECHLLREETWEDVLNNLDDISQHAVFVMIAPNLDRLPRRAVLRSHRYHFPKIKDADIASRLGKICVEEGLDYEQAALDFIASKSNGSLRDAEMMLDQLSLLEKRISMSLAYELIGTISDDELLSLLDMALSSDASNTVIRARELMRSRIDPMQLMSQLANLIMDILAGNYGEGSSEARNKFFERHTSQMDLQKLNHALKILYESEKQLRMSKNQTTWLTVALLQLSSVESLPSDGNVPKLSSRVPQCNVGDFCSTASMGEESSNHLRTCSCAGDKECKGEREEDCERTLETIWLRTTELCQSSSLKIFLRKQGKLSSLCINQGLAVIELEFDHPDHVSRAEKSWKPIARSLQSILGCNVEIRINLVNFPFVMKHSKVKKPSFRLFSCSGRMKHKSLSTSEPGSESNNSNYNHGELVMKDKPIEECSRNQSQMSYNCSYKMEVKTTLRNSEENSLVTGPNLHARESQDDMLLQGPIIGVTSVKERGISDTCQFLSVQEPEVQPNCFYKTWGQKKRMDSSETSQVIRLRFQPKNQMALSIPRKSVSKPSNLSSDSYVFSGSCNTNSSRDDDGLKGDTNVLCCLRKVRHLRTSRLVGSVLPCATAK